MKRALLVVSTIVLFGAFAATAQNNQGQNGNNQGQNGDNQGGTRPRYSAPEPGLIGMLALSATTIAGALTLKRRQND